MIALRGSKMTTIYHDIGSRIKHCRTGIDDQISDYYVLAWIYLRLTKSLVNFQIQIQNFVLSKFEKLAFGAPKTK